VTNPVSKASASDTAPLIPYPDRDPPPVVDPVGSVESVAYLVSPVIYLLSVIDIAVEDPVGVVDPVDDPVGDPVIHKHQSQYLNQIENQKHT